jgi:hypothetical protein
MTSVQIDERLVDGIARFVAERDRPPYGRMTTEQAVNSIVKDWLMGQGYIPLPNDPDRIIPALEAAQVPKG